MVNEWLPRIPGPGAGGYGKVTLRARRRRGEEHDRASEQPGDRRRRAEILRHRADDAAGGRAVAFEQLRQQRAQVTHERKPAELGGHVAQAGFDGGAVNEADDHEARGDRRAQKSKSGEHRYREHLAEQQRADDAGEPRHLAVEPHARDDAERQQELELGTEHVRHVAKQDVLPARHRPGEHVVHGVGLEVVAQRARGGDKGEHRHQQAGVEARGPGGVALGAHRAPRRGAEGDKRQQREQAGDHAPMPHGKEAAHGEAPYAAEGVERPGCDPRCGKNRGRRGGSGGGFVHGVAGVSIAFSSTDAVFCTSWMRTPLASRSVWKLPSA